jgi:hypothetical protein
VQTVLPSGKILIRKQVMMRRTFQLSRNSQEVTDYPDADAHVVPVDVVSAFVERDDISG